MLQIIVNNTPLFLKPDTKIRIEMNTSYFNTDIIKGSVVWHFDIPAYGNEETFKYANFIVVKNKFRYYNCRITLNGMSIGRGQLLISKSTPVNFRVAVSMNSFATEFDKVNLKDAPYKKEQIGGDPHSEATVLKHITEVNSGALKRDYRFPMFYAPNFYGEDVTTDDVAGDHPEYNPEYARYLNHFKDGSFISNIDANYQTFVPFPLLIPVIQKLLESKGYSLTGELVENDVFNKLLIFNNVSIDSFTSNYFLSASSEVTIQNFYNTYLKLPLEAIKDDDKTWFNYTYTVKEDGVYSIKATVACAGVYYNLDRMRDYWRSKEVEGIISIFKNGSILTEIPFHHQDQYKYPKPINFEKEYTFQLNDTIDLRIKTNDGYYSGLIFPDESFLYIELKTDNPGVNVHSNELLLKNHIPDIEVSKVINSLRNAFFMGVFFDDEKKTVHTEMLKDILNNPYTVDISNNIVYNKEEITINDTQSVYLSWQHTEDLNNIADNKLINSKYYKELGAQYRKSYANLSAANAVYRFDVTEKDKTPKWMFYRHNFQPYGKESSTIKPSISISPVPMFEVYSTETSSGGRGGRIDPQEKFNYSDKIFPYTSKSGVSHRIPDGDEDIGFQIFQWYGVYDIPYASSMHVRENNEILGTYDIDFNSEHGIVKQLGTEWLSFISASEEFKVLLGNLDIWKFIEIQSLFLPKKKANHPRWVYSGNVKALPKQFTAEIDVNGNITTAELILVKKSA